MAFVVTAACFGCKHTECVVVCPCESFHEGESMVYINPESCIDCEACASVCPTEAIFPQDQVPSEMTEFITLNREMSAILPVILERRTPLAG